jgi:hypothetical protein
MAMVREGVSIMHLKVNYISIASMW